MLPCKLLHASQMLFCSVLPCLALEWTHQYPQIVHCLPCTVDPAQCKDCPEVGCGKSDHLDFNVVFSSDKVPGKAYRILSLGERMPFIKELTLLTEDFVIRDLLCAPRGQNSVAGYKEWPEEGPVTFNPGEQRWSGLGTLLKMSQLHYFKIPIFKVDFF